jgi:uroporphyrin-III C-methyltransferase/precorrin-2 dehydrogenase/sirohydrochlorin ferrochelatase
MNPTMRYFPVFMNLHQQPVLLVGGGVVAERKARLLIKAGAEVWVVARTLCKNLERRKSTGEIRHLGTTWNEGQVKGMRLVFAATSDRELNRDVYASAEKSGIPVNVVDAPQLCRFISPAVVDRSPVQIAVSTGGTAPVLARVIRDRLETMLPSGFGKIAAAAGNLRLQVRQKLSAGMSRQFWEDLFSDDRLTTWSRLSENRIHSEMESELNAGLRGKKRGKVYLVGAGPGRAELLTLRGLDLLRKADVILHDRLVPAEILDLSRRDSDRIFVGKQAGNHHCTQREIHRIMLEQVAKGHTVVRLKGGDPFVFGRGGEEIEVLRRHGVDYEVVPGITAAVGCAAYAGIPLTHRDHAQVLSFVTGHQSGGREGSSIDWSGIAGPGKTTVVYMGIGQAKRIRRELISAGIKRDMPVALISNGSLDSQKTVTGTVDTLPGLAATVDKHSPGLLIIGQVAALSSNLAWFEQQLSLRTAA